MAGESKWRCGGGYCGTVIWKLGLGFGGRGGGGASRVSENFMRFVRAGLWAGLQGFVLARLWNFEKCPKNTNWAILALINSQAVSEPQLTNCALQHPSGKADC
jgi:hypothetical protein